MALPQTIYCQRITDELERNWNTTILTRLKGAFLLAWRWCRGGELNSLRRPFQGRALPVSYPGTGAVKDSKGALQGCQCSRGWRVEAGDWRLELRRSRLKAILRS